MQEIKTLGLVMNSAQVMCDQSIDILGHYREYALFEYTTVSLQLEYSTVQLKGRRPVGQSVKFQR